MKRLSYAMTLALFAWLVSCNTSDEEISGQIPSDPSQMLGVSTKTLTSFRSEEDGVSIEFIEAAEGSIGITVLFDSTVTDAIKDKYSNMVDEIHDEKMSLDQFYNKISGTTVDSGKERILKNAAQRLKKYRETPHTFRALSQEELSLKTRAIEQFVSQKYERTIGNSSGKTEACVTSSSNLDSKEFKAKYCNGLTADPVVDPVGIESRVSYCFYGNGPSIEKYIRSSPYYRLTIYNPYVLGDQLAFGHVILDGNFFSHFTVPPNTSGFQHWVFTNSLYAYVGQVPSSCPLVAYVTRRGVN